MKRIVSLVVICGLIAGAGFAVYHFSGARGKVVKKNVLDAIDDMLGKDKIQQQELADAIDKANRAVEIYFDGRVREQVRVESLTKGLKPVKARYEASIQKMDDMIAAVEKVSKDPTVEVSVGEEGKFNNKNVDSLKKLLAAQTEKHKAIQTEYTDKQRALTEAERSFSLLHSQEKDAREKVSLYSGRKKALDAKLEALTKQREAAKLLKSGQETAGANFDEIEKKLSELEDHAEVEFRKAEETSKIDAEKSLRTSKGGESIEDVLQAAREARGQK